MVLLGIGKEDLQAEAPVKRFASDEKVAAASRPADADIAASEFHGINARPSSTRTRSSRSGGKRGTGRPGRSIM